MVAPVIVALGLVVGSFLNVVIARLPAGRSLWAPRSACPACDTPIAWHDNIPVLSFLLLRARCRACGDRISWRYPIVEVVTAVLFLVAYGHFGLGPDFVVAAGLLATLVAITGIDLDHQIIPDKITLPGILTGVLASLATGRVSWSDSLLHSLLGIALGGGVFFVIILASGGGMGGGDMKLGAMLGAFLGWKVTIVAVFVAVAVGGVAGIAVLASGRKGRKDPIPFGPFLAVGGAVALFWGPRLLTWYLDSFAG